MRTVRIWFTDCKFKVLKYTALHAAVEFGHLHVVNLLIENGADINKVDKVK